MTLPRGTCWIGTVGVLALGGVCSAPAVAAQPPSCVGQFVMVNAPHTAGAFGGFVRDAAQSTEPNLGVGDVAPDATSDHTACT